MVVSFSGALSTGEMSFYITLLILLSCLTAPLTAEAINCLACLRVAKPEDCRTDIQCQEGEICHTEKYITDEGHVFYELGCKQVDVCNAANYLVATDELRARMNTTRAFPLVGRRQLENIAAYVCIECCDTPYCNNFLCGGHETGLECASCSEVAALEECNQITVCRPYQSCFVQEVLTDRFELRYEAGCRGEIQCNVLLQEQANGLTGGLCKRCCSQNMCNTVCKEPPSTTSLWTSPSPKATPSTAAVTSQVPITQAATTTLAPVTDKPTTTLVPITQKVTTLAPVTDKPTPTLAPVTQKVTTLAPVTDKPTTTLAPITQKVTTLAPVTDKPTSTLAPITTKTNEASTSQNVVTQGKTPVTQPNTPVVTNPATTTMKSITSPTPEATTSSNPPTPSTEATTARVTTTATTMTTTTVCPTLPYLSLIAPPKLFTNILHDVGCKGKADVAFLLDSSDNFNEFEGKELVRFVRGYTSSLDIGPDNTRVSVTLYNTLPNTYFTFDNDGDSQANVSIQLANIGNGLTKSDSHLLPALEKVHEEFENSSRPDAGKYMVIITQDNITDINKAVEKVSAIKNDSITVIVIGIGQFDGMTGQLTEMVSSPKNEHLVKIRYAEDLASVLEDLILGHCRDQRNPQVQPCWDNSQFHKDTCKAEEDTLIILDTSSNVKPEEWKKIQEYINVFIYSYDASTVNSKLGMLTYNIPVKTVFDFKPFTNKPAMLIKAKGELMNQALRGPAFTDAALEKALELFQNDSRDAIKNVILFTNGKSVHKMRSLTAALELQRYGVNVYVVGVGDNVDLKEQMILASNPDVDHVLKIGSGQDELKTHLEYMAAKKCNKTKPVAPVFQIEYHYFGGISSPQNHGGENM